MLPLHAQFGHLIAWSWSWSVPHIAFNWAVQLDGSAAFPSSRWPLAGCLTETCCEVGLVVVNICLDGSVLHFLLAFLLSCGRCCIWLGRRHFENRGHLVLTISIVSAVLAVSHVLAVVVQVMCGLQRFGIIQILSLTLGFSNFWVAVCGYVALGMLVHEQATQELDSDALGRIEDPSGAPTLLQSSFKLSLRSVRFSDVGIDVKHADEGTQTCAICLEDFAADDLVSPLSCGHCFHTKCMNSWLDKGCMGRCPMRCQPSLSTEEGPVSAEMERDESSSIRLPVPVQPSTVDDC